jgi:hypothetical protein
MWAVVLDREIPLAEVEQGDLEAAEIDRASFEHGNRVRSGHADPA